MMAINGRYLRYAIESVLDGGQSVFRVKYQYVAILSITVLY